MGTNNSLRNARWLLPAAGACAALLYAVNGHATSAQRLFSYLSVSSSSCTGTSYGTLLAEAWGSDSSGNYHCNLGPEAGSTAETLCYNDNTESTNNTNHYAMVGAINSGGGILDYCSASSSNWTTTVSCSYSVPDNSNCPGGGSATAYAWGENIP